MGRNSRAKKQKRDAKRGGRAGVPRGRIPVSGPQMITVSFGGGDHVDDGCPICVAMREMGVADGEPLSARQMDRLMEAFGEAEKAGGIGFRAPPGEN